MKLVRVLSFVLGLGALGLTVNYIVNYVYPLIPLVRIGSSQVLGHLVLDIAWALVSLWPRNLISLLSHPQVVMNLNLLQYVFIGVHVAAPIFSIILSKFLDRSRLDWFVLSLIFPFSLTVLALLKPGHASSYPYSGFLGGFLAEIFLGPSAVSGRRIEEMRKEDAVSGKRIGEMRKKADVNGLIAMLKKPDLLTRERSSKALAELGIAAVEPLVALLADKDADLRFRAVKTLGRIGDNRAIEPLIATLAEKPLFAALNDREEPVRWAAMEALEKIDGPEAEQRLPKETRGVLILETYWGNDQDGTTYKMCATCGSQPQYSMSIYASSTDHLYRVGNRCPKCATLFTKVKHIDHK